MDHTNSAKSSSGNGATTPTEKDTGLQTGEPLLIAKLSGEETGRKCDSPTQTACHYWYILKATEKPQLYETLK
jgi:hypothetical protein